MLRIVRSSDLGARRHLTEAYGAFASARFGGQRVQMGHCVVVPLVGMSPGVHDVRYPMQPSNGKPRQ